ncbi:MAG: hypothetical protein KJP25_05305 [Gammaproteobacteria bacterium]|nr:hypothetical protein [Gammaproteobacteria bacterium]NND38225.1 hypothetical protein [Pseudomonadales bacterium]MBT8152057.1 hypothetical protein [Gammaproteobacteria bacterium]NNL11031.1 hypothetical protein [Pseudomonadales bacterium]NNM12043.1 hypothetical protein [Pseudomonadales bacterium]
MKLRLLLPVGLALLLAACASNTPYRSADGGKFGYRDASLGDDRHRVVFTQRSPDVATAMDYALLRAAELTLLEGKEWFIVRDRQTTLDREREPATSVSMSQGRVVERNCGLLGCRTTSRPAPATVHGAVRSGSSRSEVQAILEVELGSGSKPENGDVYTASETRSALRSRLGVNS